LIPCHACGLLCRSLTAPVKMRCPRCHARLHARKPDSIARTWAFLISACILYVPANTLPVLETRSLFDSQSNTIMSGVILFWNDGSWFVAALIFFASIVVPLTKLIALALLLVSIQRRMAWQPYQRTRLYRLLDYIGRWSMLDIYVAALSVALVQVESFTMMRAGLGAVAFGAVVVLTMLAVQVFDPRLIWDTGNIPEEHNA
jgi:paraquat-inducible protein A